MRKYIVVTEKQNWGTGETLLAACKSAQLAAWSPSDHFVTEIEATLSHGDTSFGELSANWDEYVWDEYTDMNSERVACTIYFFDDGPDSLWHNYNISHIDGTVCFSTKLASCPTQDEIDEAFEKCHMKAYWQGGKLTRRTEAE